MKARKLAKVIAKFMALDDVDCDPEGDMPDNEVKEAEKEERRRIMAQDVNEIWDGLPREKRDDLLMMADLLVQGFEVLNGR